VTTNKTAMILALTFSVLGKASAAFVGAQDDDESARFIIPGNTDRVHPVFSMITSAARQITPASRGSALTT
jgi:hypothetical protein